MRCAMLYPIEEKVLEAPQNGAILVGVLNLDEFEAISRPPDLLLLYGAGMA